MININGLLAFLQGTIQEMPAASAGGRGARSSCEGRAYAKGAFFGESALIGPGVRKETVVAGGLEARGFQEPRSPVSSKSFAFGFVG